MADTTVLVVDDNADLLATLTGYLGDHGFRVTTARGRDEALQEMAANPHDVVLTDIRMQGGDGLDVLAGVHRLDPDIPVVLMTAFGSVESAVDAMQRGAYQYVTKPFKMANVRVMLERAARERKVHDQNRQLRAAFNERFAARGLIGGSASMRDLKKLIARLAATHNPVLITGETGSGKELVARAIHVESDRRDEAFVAVSCAVPPEALLESELFGHVASAFPHAPETRQGLFMAADKGTLFLDEVGDMPLALQGRLLRVLESGEIRPVGGTSSRAVNVRCIASTQADLAELVRLGTFRKDLFFRLNVIPVPVPPLRQRREDIPMLVEHFLAQAHARAHGDAAGAISDAALRLLESQAWPGNVRELHNLIERLVTTGTSAVIDVDAVEAALTPPVPGDALEAMALAAVSLEDLEARYTAAVLRMTEGNKSKAAAILGIDLSTLYRRAKQTRG